MRDDTYVWDLVEKGALEEVGNVTHAVFERIKKIATGEQKYFDKYDPSLRHIVGEKFGCHGNKVKEEKNLLAIYDLLIELKCIGELETPGSYRDTGNDALKVLKEQTPSLEDVRFLFKGRNEKLQKTTGEIEFLGKKSVTFTLSPAMIMALKSIQETNKIASVLGAPSIMLARAIIEDEKIRETRIAMMKAQAQSILILNKYIKTVQPVIAAFTPLLMQGALIQKDVEKLVNVTHILPQYDALSKVVASRVKRKEEASVLTKIEKKLDEMMDNINDMRAVINKILDVLKKHPDDRETKELIEYLETQKKELDKTVDKSYI